MVWDTYRSGNPSGQLIIVAGHATNDGATAQARRAQIVDFLLDEALARNVPFVDLAEAFGGWAELNALGAYADVRHGYKAFYARQADLLASIIAG